MRWKLAAPHYLNTEGVTWLYTEMDRKTGKQKRVEFPVPLYLNPHDAGDWNYTYGTADDAEGQIIVCHKGKGDGRDIVFIGDPTPDMVPLDDEARELSATFADRWRYKPEGTEGQYSQSLIDRFQGEMETAASKPVEIPGMSDLVAAMQASVAQTNTLITALASNRRV